MKKLSMIVVIWMSIIAFGINGLDNENAGPGICIMVQKEYEPYLSDSLDSFKEDLESNGNHIIIKEYGGESPSEIRSYLKDIYRQYELQGCYLIGDIPTAWFEGAYTDQITSEIAHLKMPTNMYYMDLNGTWKDTDKNNIFDQHSGDIKPEIWVSRLKVPSGSFPEKVNEVRRYLLRNHLYRNGALYLPDSSLAYMDRATGFSPWYGLEKMCAYCEVVLEPDTVPENYLHIVQEGWQYLLFWSHGTPGCHLFHDSSENPQGEVCYTDIIECNPKVFFYTFESCLTGKFTENNYIAGWYLFTDYGLFANAWTVIRGGSWDYDLFYRKLLEEKTFAAASMTLLEWYADEDDLVELRPNNYYGYALFGDPLLYPESKGIDTDGDVLTDDFESSIGLDPSSTDTDGDGIDDYTELLKNEEIIVEDSGKDGDSDEDGVPDDTELIVGTDPFDSDTDDDGLPDNLEIGIAVDGLREDWKDIDPVLTDEKGDIRTDTKEARDLRALYLLMDKEFVFIMIEFYDKPNPKNWVEVAFDLDFDGKEDFRLSYRNISGQASINNKKDVELESALFDVIEFKLPLDVFNGKTEMNVVSWDFTSGQERSNDYMGWIPVSFEKLRTSKSDPLDPDTDDDGLVDGEDPHPLEKEEEWEQRISEEAEGKFNEALAAFDNEDYGSAIVLFREAQSRYGSVSDSGRASECQNYIDRCTEYLEKIQSKANAETLLDEGITCFHQEQYEEAKTEFEEAFAIFTELQDEEKTKECKDWIALCEEAMKPPEEGGFCLGTMLLVGLIGTGFVVSRRSR